MTGAMTIVERITRRPAAAAAAYAAIVVVLAVIVWQSVAGVLARQEAVAASAEMLAQIEGRPRALRAGPGSAGAGPAGSPFVEGDTITVAGATLVQRVSSAISRAGGALLSSQVELDRVEATGRDLSLSVSCEIDDTALQALLYDLEAGMPFLFVDQLVAQAPVAGDEGARGRMRLVLTVSGRWRGAR